MEGRTILVTLEDGTNVEYVIRGLEENEIQGWAEFCASVFSYKTNPPSASYFERHFYNDPNRDAELIRVMISSDTKEIVSSCRIFVRDISLGADESSAGYETKSIAAGGIGEVCTDVAHRKRGLSKLLLQDAIAIMKDRKMEVSMLHAAPDFFPVYQRGGGFANTVSRWTVLTIETEHLPTSESIRLAEFPRDTNHLQALHREYSEGSFVGCIVRSEAYWNNYLSKELEGSLYVIEIEETIVAWMSVRVRGSRLQLCEFGCDVCSFTSETFFQLLEKCLKDTMPQTPENSTEPCTIDLHLPTFVAEPIMTSEYIQDNTAVTENDSGWMYLSLQSEGVDVVALNRTRPHLIWPSDSF